MQTCNNKGSFNQYQQGSLEKRAFFHSSPCSGEVAKPEGGTTVPPPARGRLGGGSFIKL